MNTFRNLHMLLESFERGQFATISAPGGCGAVPCSAAHGGIQFVSIEQGSANHDEELPVVVGVGVNYCQDPKNPTCPKLDRWLRGPVTGLPTIIDPAPAMRMATDFAIQAYNRNPSDWMSCVRPSGLPFASTNVPTLSRYILVATNFSPFITLKQWSMHTKVEQRSLLAAWSYASHLNALFALIGISVDLWIGHGKTHVWPLFDAWQRATGLAPWMVTYNLSGLGLAGMRRAKTHPKHPLHCLYK